jgi:hypothetical protein
MFQWALLKHTILTENTLIEEAVAVDGLENFAGDQYEPNNINQAVGYGSLFIYDFGFAPMNRKGKMSDRQKAINKELEATQGRFDTQAIRTNFGEVVRRLIRKKSPKNEALTLHTDEHYQYKRAIRYDLRDLPIDHKTISSKAARNFQNILFSVNHSDLLIRQHVGAFKRETICFSKTHSRMIQKFALFMVWTNYFRPQYVRKHKLRPNAHRNTPAMHLGITKRCLKFFEFFDVKRTLKQVSLNPEWQMFYDETPTFTRTLREAVN